MSATEFKEIGYRMVDWLGEFRERRSARDATLPAPVLLYPSLQVNIRGGRLPPAEANGRRYLSTPLQGDIPAALD